MFNFYICNTCFPIALNPTILSTSYLQGRMGQKNNIKSPEIELPWKVQQFPRFLALDKKINYLILKDYGYFVWSLRFQNYYFNCVFHFRKLHMYSPGFVSGYFFFKKYWKNVKVKLWTYGFYVKSKVKSEYNMKTANRRK